MGRLDYEELTPDVVRSWAYDEEAYLLEQDEDLLLHQQDLVPVLLEVASDDACPKQDYALCVLCQYVRNRVTRGGERGQEEIEAVWSLTTEPKSGPPLDWYRYTQRLLGYATPSGPCDQAAARRAAEDLLLGIAGRVGQLVEAESPSAGVWRFTLQTSVTEHVDVSQSTGAYVYTPWY